MVGGGAPRTAASFYSANMCITHRLSQNPAIFTSKNISVSSGNTITQSDTDEKNDKDIISESDIDDDDDEEEEEDIIAIFGTETDDEQSSDDDECDEEICSGNKQTT